MSEINCFVFHCSLFFSFIYSVLFFFLNLFCQFSNSEVNISVNNEAFQLFDKYYQVFLKSSLNYFLNLLNVSFYFIKTD